ncbi:ATP-binding protein [Bradyrhizobium prioriisuperbiae]|uniref:ATP-binding protein n=1 Tax=Bradyrhizobium prioriisuperbiae TaxID=2854389 RepID=UPI0028EA3380|nr:ATP-binding protein [Bradyrhizobium prioritasuperba]
MTSLRQTLMTHITVLLMIVGFAAAATAYVFVKYEVNSFQDNALQEVALNAGLIYRHEIQPRIDAELEDQLVVQIWDHDGKLLHRSGPHVDIPYRTDLGYFDVTAGGENWRVFRASDPQHAVQISQRWSAREEVAAYAAAGAAVPLIVAIPIAWLLIAWSVKRVLSGLGQLSTDIGERSADARDALSLTGVPVEIAPLVGAMNSLIERHQLALETQRRFVSDAAHELRTPLAALQIQIDNLRARDLTGDIGDIAIDLLAGIRRAGYLVNQLMTMVRADASMEGETETVDVRALVSLVASGFVPLAKAKGIELSINVDEDIPMTTRASDVQLLLSNLLDNAVRYTDGGGLVSIHGKYLDGSVVIDITDSGCGIPEAALPYLYDRFFRAAPPDIEGTGLGLAIAKTAADRNGFHIAIGNRPGCRGVKATVRIPSGSALADPANHMVRAEAA